jgi:hypothetical protein
VAWRDSVARARFFCLLRHTGRLAAACLHRAQAFLARPHPNCAPFFSGRRAFREGRPRPPLYRQVSMAASDLPRPSAGVKAFDSRQRFTLSAREGERTAHNRRRYGDAELRLLSDPHARRRRQVGQRQEPKGPGDSRHKGSSHRKNRRVKRQHGFDPPMFKLISSYACAPIVAVTARTAR